MSKFLKALEQAELDRALREQGRAPIAEVAEVAPSAFAGDQRDLLTESVPADAPAPEPSVETTDGVEPHLVSLLSRASYHAEAYRALRHTVEQLRRTSNLAVIAFSSPTKGDGKTTTAVNLAGALAQAPQARVLLVDADLRQPSVANYLGLNGQGRRGLVDTILDPHLGLKDVVRRCPAFNLSVLSAGRRTSAPYEVLASPRLETLMDEARRDYEYVLVDTAPLIPLPDSRLIGKWVDGFLVVVNAHKTPRKLLEEALNSMDPTKIVGLVWNGDDRPVSSYSYAYAYGMSGRSDEAPESSGVLNKISSAFRHRLGREKTGPSSEG